MKSNLFAKYPLFFAFTTTVACLTSVTTLADDRKVEPIASKTNVVNEDEQRRFDTFYLEAVVQREKGNIDNAFELLRHALEISPDAPEALYDMARLQLTYNVADTSSATEKLLQRAVALEPNNYYFQKELADYYDTRNMTDSAIARYEAMSEQFKDRDMLIYNLIEIYKQKKDYKALIRTLNKLELQEGKSEDISMERAVAYRAAEQSDSAKAEINELIRLYPADLRYRVMLGGLLYDENRPQEALDEYNKVLAEEPQNEAANYALLKYYQDEGDDSLFLKTAGDIAVNTDFETKIRATALNQLVIGSIKGRIDTISVTNVFKTIDSQPQADATLEDMYQAFLVMQQAPIDTIAPVWKKVLNLKPDYTQLRLKLLQYNIQKTEYAEAARLCDEGAQYEPEQTAYYFYGGMVSFTMKDNARAVATLKRGTEQIGNETSIELASDMYGLLGDVYHDMGYADSAYQAYDSALVYKADNISALNNYAYYLSLERKDLDRAAEMSLRTIKAEPHNAIYLDTYAWILFEQGKIEEAYTFISQALENVSPTEENASIYEHAGDIISLHGDVQTAVEMWKKAESLKCKSKTLRKKIKRKKYIAQ